MRAIFTLAMLFVFLKFAASQDYVYHENFELPSGADSVTSSGPNSWAISTTLHASGAQSDSIRTPNSDSIILQTVSFSTIGTQIAYLEFKHICKIEYFDNAEIWVSGDNGATYSKLTQQHYMGTSFFGTQGNAFHDASYADWQPGIVGAIPTNAWWKYEKFNISSIAANSANVIVKFVLRDGVSGAMGHGNYYGWLIDDIGIWKPSSQAAALTSYRLPFALTSGCGLANETFQIVVKNVGGTSILGNLNASFQRVGLPAVTEVIPATILAGDSFVYTFINKINLTPVNGDTTYYIKTWISLPSDAVHSDDSLSGSFLARIPLPSPVINDTTIPFHTSVSLHAFHSTDTCSWYSDPQAVNMLKYGANYTTPVLDDTTTYYVQAGGGGKDSLATIFATNNSSAGNMFNLTALTSAITIDSLYVNMSAASTVEVWYRPGTYLGYTTSNTGWTLAGSYVVTSPAGTNNPTHIPIGNITIPAGQTYGMYVTSVAGIMLYTNGTTANDVYQNADLKWEGGYGGSYFSVTIASRTWNGKLFYKKGSGGNGTACPSIAKPVKVMISGIPHNDAGAIQIVSPTGILTGGTPYPITAKIKNFGVDTLKKVTVNWSLNGVLKTPFLWTGALAKNNTSTAIALGTETFTSGVQKIKVWTSMPNDSNDVALFNDTLNGQAYVCLDGVMTIGGATADFPDLQSVKSVLDNVGICGPVTFKINPGTYAGNIAFTNVLGSSGVNTLTFESATGNASDVIIQYAANAAADNFVIQLNGADYFTFNNLTIKATGATYGYAIELKNGSDSNTFRGNNIISPMGSSSYFAGVYDYTTLNHYNNYLNNKITGGYYGMYIYGVGTTSWEKATVIKGNEVSNFYLYGIMLYYQDSCQVIGNYIHDGTNSYYYGLNLYYCNNGYNVLNNKIVLSPSAYCYALRDYYGNHVTYNANPTSYGTFANNFVSITSGTGTNYLFYAYYSNGSKYLHNTFNLSGGLVGSYLIYQYNTATNLLGQTFQNNICANNVGGYAGYFGTPASVVASDYNDYYTNGSSLVYWGAAMANLSALQTASGMDMNSKTINPSFSSVFDVHLNNGALNNLGTPVGILDDIDGDMRDLSTPDIGADEFDLIYRDAAVTSMVSPLASCPNSVASVAVAIKNFGVDTIKSYTLDWAINGVAQPTINGNDTIPFGNQKIKTLGNYTFLAGVNYTLKFWVSSPNGLADQNHLNDTLLIPIYKTALPSGTYTIGATGADFTSVTQAVDTLKLKGICGPVVFNIAPGVYNGRVELTPIAGASSINTITFQSTTGVNTSVTLQYSAVGAGDNSVIGFNGGDYITFKNMTLKAMGPTYSHVIDVRNSANYNTIEGNIIISAGTSSSTSSGVYDNTGNDNYNKYINNKITGGYYGMYIYGSSSTSWQKANIIKGNDVSAFYYYGIYTYYSDSIILDGNYVHHPQTTSAYFYGLLAYYCNNAYEVVNNKVILSPSTYAYAMYDYYGNYTTYNPTPSGFGLVANNYVNITSGTGTNYLMYAYYSNGTKYYHNTLVMGGGAVGSYQIYQYNTASNSAGQIFKNNILVNKVGGQTAYFGTPTSITASDYNNFYTNGTSLIYYGAAFNTLAAYQAASGKDAHSKTLDPKFPSSTDFHLKNIALNNAGTPVNIKKDIEGEVRDTLKPDMGCDEFFPLDNDVRIIGMYTLGKVAKKANNPLKTMVVVENAGVNNKYNLPITLNVSGANSANIIHTYDSLVSGQTDTLWFAGYNSTNLGVQTVKAFLPTDMDTTNNVLVYRQEVTDSVFGMADTSVRASQLGYNTGSGLLLAKYYIATNRIIRGVNAYITGSGTVGKQVYAVMLSKTGVLIDTSAKLTIAISDTGNWASFTFPNALYNNVNNDSVYVGIAQVANAAGFFPLGMQAENPARPNVLFGAGLTGGALTPYQQFGRPMIEAVTGKAPGLDIKAMSFTAPSTNCNLGNEIVKFKIKNIGDDTIFGATTGLTIGYKLINGGGSPIVVPVTDTIYPGQEYIKSFPVAVNMTSNVVDSTFKFVGFATLNGDIFHNNDTSGIYTAISRKTPLAPIVSNITIPYATSGAILATSLDTVAWYKYDTSNIIIYKGATYNTPLLYDTTKYWAESTTKSINPITVTVGNGTTVNGSSAYPAPYGNYYWGSKEQYLILASELTALGASAGDINSLAWDVTTINSCPPLQAFEIKMGHTTQTSLTTTLISTGLVSKYTNASYQPINGWNTHVFSSPFIWDGVSNVVVEVCFNNSAWVSGGNASVNQSSTAFNSTINVHQDAAGVCALATGTTYTQRPNLRLNTLGIVDGCASAKVPVTVFITGTPANDAGVISIAEPTAAVVGYVSNTAKISIHNYGTSPLTSAKISWSINGIQKPAFYWTGNLASDSNSAVFAIGTYNVPAGLNIIKAWTDSINGVGPTYATNDTVAKNFTACMSGVFTVGDASSDFISITDAINRIKIGGLCGPVVLNVKSGVYTEFIDFTGIVGLSAVNTLTIQSLTGNSNDVLFQFAGTSTQNYVIRFNGADYVTIRNISFKNTSSTYGTVVDLSNGANRNTIYGNKLESAGSTGTSCYVINSTSTALDQYNVIRKNQILNGYYAIYIYGNSSTGEKGNIIDSNSISGFYYYGIYNNYQDSFVIHQNNITGSNASGVAYGIYSYYNRGYGRITNNKVFMLATGTTYGIAVYYNTFNVTTPGLVANNFVSNINSTGTVYNLYDYYSDNVNYYNNNIACHSASAGSYNAYQAGGSGKTYLNNIFANYALGYAWYVGTYTSINVSNFNGFYTNGPNLAYWDGNRVNLDSLKANSKKDSLSKFGNPNFLMNGDLHTKTVLFNNCGKYLASVSNDIDGEARSLTTPDIGADEFTPPANDAGVIAYLLPLSPVSPTSQSVKLKIMNFGTNVLANTSINWSVNNVVQTPFLWTGSLGTLVASDTIAIGNYTFNLGANSMKFWTSIPNGQVDGEASNDTLLYSVYGCNAPYSGTYTIGGAGANFSTINDAINGLKYCGISGPVVLNINPGTYTEQIVIPKINGSSASNTVTLRSANGLASSVIITNTASTSAANYTIKLDSARYITLSNLTIKATNPSFGRVVEIFGSAKNINIDSNIIEAPVSTSSTSAGIYMVSTYKPEFIKIRGNNITNGYYGIFLSSNSSSLLSRNNVIENNSITNWYYYGTYLYGLVNLEFRKNLITNSASSTTVYGCYVYYCDSALVFEKNKIILNTASTIYALYLSYCDGVAATRGSVSNNFISLQGSTGTAYGLYSYYSTYQDVSFNSINVACGSATGGVAAYLYYGNNNNFKNNNFVNTAALGGYAVYVSSTTAPVVFSQSNYNNFFTNGTTLGYYGAAVLNLAAWKTATGQDANSISIDPSYTSATNLHASSVGLNGKATPIAGITTDIDGDLRNATTPDIGADEFISYNQDAGIVSYLSPTISYGPQGNAFDVTVKIKNFGTDTLTSIPISYQLGSNPIENGIWVGSLPPSATANYQFTTQGTLPLGQIKLKSWSSLSADQNLTNDSISLLVTGLPLLNLGWSDNFDGPVLWSTSGIMNAWQHGVPTSAIINSAHSAPNVWKTNLSGQYYNSDTSYLFSPYFNFQNISDATMNFWHRYETQVTSDQCKIQFSQDLGATWINLGVQNDTLATHWYNTATAGQHSWTGSSTTWVNSTYILSQFNNSLTPIQFRFQFISNASVTSDGWAIDDFKITLAPAPIDAKLDSIVSSSTPIVYGVAQTVKIRIKNEGTNTLTSIPVHYSVNGANFVYDTWTGSLASGASTEHTFSQSFTPLFAGNSFQLCAAVDVTGDPYDQNDSVCYSLIQLPPPHDAGVYRIESPSMDTTYLGNQYTVKIWFRNYGTSAITTMNLQYKAGLQAPVVEPWTGNLAPNDSATYTFTQKYTPQPAWYQLCAKTILANDAKPSNDEICRNKYGTVGMEELWMSLYLLDQNKPNPVSEITNIGFEVPVYGKVSFKVTDVLGQVIHSEQLEVSAGRHQVDLDVSHYSEGLYYYSIEIDGHRLVKKMTVIK